MKSNIDQLVIDLNNETFIISEDISKVKKGMHVNVDSKKTKRKVRRLEEEAKMILNKANLISGQKENSLEQSYNRDNKKDKDRRRSQQPYHRSKKPDPAKHYSNMY